MAPKGNTGEQQILKNVVASWMGHFVYIIAGFILPRMIDSHLGQELLGIWDFSWSLVAYFSLVQGGVVSSVNRYVAKYIASREVKKVNRTVSTACCCLALMSILVVILALVMAVMVPLFFGDRLGSNTWNAQWIIFILGCSIAVELLFSGYGGVLTGSHNWWLYNLIFFITKGIVLIGMLLVLSNGGGLIGLATVNLLGEIAGRLVRCVYAYKVYPPLSVRFAYVSFVEARRLLLFGGKATLPSIANLILNHSVSILIVSFLGPSALAVYSRPRALIRHVLTLLAKFSYVITPTASAMQSINQSDRLRNLFFQTTRWSGYITFPIIATLIILGGSMLSLWMGEQYKEGGATILVILAVGYLPTITQRCMRAVLTGINAHGVPGGLSLIAAIISVLFVFLALHSFQFGLPGVALAVVVPLIVVDAIIVPMYACKILEISIHRFVANAFLFPFLAVLPMVTVQVGMKYLFWGSDLKIFFYGSVVGGIVLLMVYWKFIFSHTVKAKIINKFSSFSLS